MAQQDVLKAWSARKHLMLGFAAVLVLVGGFGTWATMSRLASAIVAPGAIEVEQNRQVVQHPDGGVVASIEVKEGDVVTAGQVLIRLDAKQMTSELKIIESQLFELLARRGRLEAERDAADEITYDKTLTDAAEHDPEVLNMLEGNRALFAQRRENIMASIEQLRKRNAQIASQIDGIDAQIDALNQQIVFIEEELANKQTLFEKGLAQSPQILALQRQKASLHGSVGEITARRAQAGENMIEYEIEILKTEARFREAAISALSEQEGRELELAERRRALLERLNRLDIRAPISGAVHALSVFGEKAVIRPAEPVLFIVPQDRPLIIGVQVETIHVDQINVGQEVILRFSALDSRMSPEIFGRVVSISPDALNDERTGRSYYRARITMLEGEIDKLPPGTVLIPGMPVEAYLRTGDRSPLAYLIKPFADYFNRAFREN